MVSKQITAGLVLDEIKAAMNFPIMSTDQNDYSDDKYVTPRDIRQFLAHLRLLEGVPFNNIVADSELLPLESIRFFYVDRAWTDALTQGALSVGTVNSGDRAQLEHLYKDIEKEVDDAEHRVRTPASETPQTGPAGLMTGFLLRSRAVSGWPGLHVRAYKTEPGKNDQQIVLESSPARIKLLRLERLAPAVLLALFDGLPKVVHIEEPRQGLQFGVTLRQTAANTYSASVPARNVQTAKYVGNSGSDVETAADAQRLPVRFRAGSPGVLDLANTARAFLAVAATNMNTDSHLDGAEFALEMLRFPYRQVFGDPKVTTDHHISAVFRPTVALKLSELTTAFRKEI